jgi:signal transduction histidine kinase
MPHHLLSHRSEAINNIMKHSGASEAESSVEKNGDEISLSIRDDGGGFSFDQNSGMGKGGFGLTGIKERASPLGES